MEVQSLSLTSIAPSPNNPRKSFDVDELAASIKRDGVLQPITVRRLEGEGPPYEIVFGERRWRAAVKAGLEEIPAVLVDASGEQIEILRVVENVQREDLPPMEEAEGLATLLRHLPAEEVAERTGKSLAYVYGRAKLAELPAIAKKALQDGEIQLGAGLLIARIGDAKLRAEAAKVIVGAGKWSDGPMSVREAREYLIEQVLLNLKNAPFDPASPELDPKAGPCTTCPFRTGMQATLFEGDIGDGERCTQPGCFRRKCDAAHALRVEKLKAEGVRPATKKETEQAFRYASHSGHVSEATGFLDVNEEHRDERGRKRDLSKLDVPRVVLQDPTGRTRVLARVGDVRKALPKAPPEKRPLVKKTPAELRRERDQRVSARTTELAIAGITESAVGLALEFDDEQWRFLALCMFGASWHDTQKAVAAAREWVVPKQKHYAGRDYVAAATTWIRAEGTSAPHCAGLVVELLVRKNAHAYRRGVELREEEGDRGQEEGRQEEGGEEVSAASREYHGFRIDGRAHVVIHDGCFRAELPQQHNLLSHSPDGFEWGYHGSGPAQLALALLAQHADDATAIRHHQHYKSAVVARLPREGPWTIKAREVRLWLDSHGATSR